MHKTAAYCWLSDIERGVLQTFFKALRPRYLALRSVFSTAKQKGGLRRPVI
jgi:hypothetical protein